MSDEWSYGTHRSCKNLTPGAVTPEGAQHVLGRDEKTVLLIHSVEDSLAHRAGGTPVGGRGPRSSA